MDPKIIAETDDYFVINKPAGMAVEPPSPAKTLRDWLLEKHCINSSNWQEADRYGVVHRIDTDTSGLVIWAKNKTSQEQLKLAWQGRQVEKTYLALVIGECDAAGEIELPISRDNKNDRMKVEWLGTNGRPAITTFKRLDIAKIGDKTVSLVEAHPITGRTHQIRVHFKAKSHPLIGDKLYGEKATDELAKALGLARHFLHATKICLPTGECYQAPLPEDLAQTLEKLDIKNPLT